MNHKINPKDSAMHFNSRKQVGPVCIPYIVDKGRAATAKTRVNKYRAKKMQHVRALVFSSPELLGVERATIQIARLIKRTP